jgi:hypothetical protein
MQIAQQTLKAADAKVATLQGEVVRQKEKADEKDMELEIKNYAAETDRLKVVGGLDPVSLQLIVRRLVSDMMQTDIIPALKQHAANEASIQQTLQPPQPADGAGAGSDQGMQSMQGAQAA